MYGDVSQSSDSMPVKTDLTLQLWVHPRARLECDCGFVSWVWFVAFGEVVFVVETSDVSSDEAVGDVVSAVVGLQ